MSEIDITETCFNFEISKGTALIVRNFLQSPVLVNKMTDQAYNVGSVKIYDVPSVRKWEFTQLLSFETLYMVYAGFENGFFTGYIRNVNANTGENSYKYTERTGTDKTRKYWHANARSGDISPLSIIRNRTYDHRSREWYKEAKTAGKTTWSSIYRFASSNELGLTHCQPIYDIDYYGLGTSHSSSSSSSDDDEKKIGGVVAVDYTLGNINRFLSTAFHNSTSTVILVEHDTGLLVASSRPGGLLLAVENADELPTRVTAWNSTDEIIKTVSNILQKDKDGWSERLIKKDGYFIEVVNFKANNLNWDIIVAMPAGDFGDQILMVDSTLHTLFIIAVFIGVFSLVILSTIMLKQRQKNIWKAASPMFLITFACALICWNLSSLLFLVRPTATSCMSRTWAFNVTYIFVFAVLFIKVQRMNALYLKLKKKIPTVKLTVKQTVKHMEPKQFLKGISSIVFVEILLQMLWSVIDPNQVVVFHSQQQSISTTAITETLFCRSQTITFPMIAMTSKLIFILCGCNLAWQNQHLLSIFAESKQITMVMYQFAVLSILLLPLHYCIPYAFDPNVKSVQRLRLIIQVCVILWVSVASAFLFFGTRIMKLRAFGDTSLQQTVREQLVESQRNAAHDIRNALMEVIGLVDMFGEKKKKGKKNSSEKSEKSEKSERKTAEHISSSTSSNSELGHNSSTDSNFEHKNKLSLRVHDVTKRILHRLDASLRDEQNVVQNNSRHLYPEINSVDLKSIMKADLIFDDLVRLSISENFPETIETDLAWIRTIVQNLVHNAKKHGPKGEIIHVRMSYLPSTCEASIEVTDQGKGVSPVQAREIFNLAKASSTTDSSGNGIGLRATLTYISGLGGTCGADGATFWIKFPLKRDGINGLSIHGASFQSFRAERIFFASRTKNVSVSCFTRDSFL